jgi:hypothetical protein
MAFIRERRLPRETSSRSANVRRGAARLRGSGRTPAVALIIVAIVEYAPLTVAPDFGPPDASVEKLRRP